jgi:uncharacterized protein YhdP
MALNYDEEAATAAAYEAMSTDAETYSMLIAKASSVNAENLSASAEEGATNQASALQQLSLKWQQFTSQLKNVAKAVKKALSGEEVGEVWSELKSDISITRERYNAVDLTKYDFSDPERYTPTAALEAVSKDITTNA